MPNMWVCWPFVSKAGCWLLVCSFSQSSLRGRQHGVRCDCAILVWSCEHGQVLDPLRGISRGSSVNVSKDRVVSSEMVFFFVLVSLQTR